MASPVDTSVKFFSSTMVNAPVLNGTAGALIALLDACLKDGFDTKSATSLVVVGGVATLVYSGTHSAEVDSVVTVSGSSISTLNGEQKITAKSANSVSFATAAVDGSASGSISFKMAPSTWTKPFSGTNLAVYKSADPLATTAYLRVDDSGTTFARVLGYETMSDVSTGTGPFPTTAQMSGGGYWSKSTLANSTGNPWFLITDGRCFYLHVQPAAGATPGLNQGFTRFFGDPIALRPSGDAFSAVLSYSNTATILSEWDGAPDGPPVLQIASPRSYTGVGSSVLQASLPYVGTGVTSGIDPYLGAYPSPVDGAIRLAKRFLTFATTGGAPRSDFPGMYHVPHSGVSESIKFGDTIVGTGQVADRRLRAVRPAATTITTPTVSNSGTTFFDVTGPWR